MGIRAGDQVLISWSEESHEFRVATHKQRLHQARELVKRYVDTDGSVVDELIQERRQATVSAVYGEVLAFHIAIITSMDMTIES